MELTVQNVYGLLIRSKLLSLDEARAMYTHWRQEAKEAATNLTRFADWMVQHNYLTQYQAYLLVRGHADGFFLNEYKILDRLGQGRMAGVYKAQHQLGQIVAIKVLPPSKARDPNMLARFQREARLAMKLKHPNIVRTFQVGKAGELHFLVMEYLEGEPLADVMARRKNFPPAEAVRLIYQALQGLQHIHAQGLVHRDLKPANLMLVPAPSALPPSSAGERGSGEGAAHSTLRCTLKILDIGLGRALFGAEAADEESSLDPSLTGEGVLLGTPDYMAPEQARDARAIDIRADIYSLGCVLYHLLAGQPPFPDSNIISQMIRHATEPAAPLNKFNPSVPNGLQQIVNWMIAKEPAGRYPTPERAAQALQVFLAAGHDPLAAPENDPKMRSYLTWLELEDQKPKSPAGPPGQTIPDITAGESAPSKPAETPTVVTTPQPAPVALPGPATKQPSGKIPAAPANPKTPAASRDKAGKGLNRSRSAKEKRRLKKRKRQEAGAAAAAVAQPASVPTIDVELLPAGAKGRFPARFSLNRLSRRELAMFGVGAGVGAIATFLGFLVALSTKRVQPSTTPAPEPPPPDGPS
jgi:serine/threonine protein kinase